MAKADKRGVPQIAMAGVASVGKTNIYSVIEWISGLDKGTNTLDYVVDEKLSEEGVTSYSLKLPERTDDNSMEIDRLNELWYKQHKNNPTSFEHEECTVSHAGQKITFLLYDTAGQGDYDSINHFHFKDSNIFIIVFSAIDRNSLVGNNYIDQIRTAKNNNDSKFKKLKFILVRTKIDMIGKRFSEKDVTYSEKVSEKDLEEFANEKNLKNFQIVSVSGLCGKNIDKLCESIVKSDSSGSIKKKGFLSRLWG